MVKDILFINKNKHHLIIEIKELKFNFLKRKKNFYKVLIEFKPFLFICKF